MFQTLGSERALQLSRRTQIEYQGTRRLSFYAASSAGLGDRGLPDAKTVWLYRDALAQAGKVEEFVSGV